MPRGVEKWYQGARASQMSASNIQELTHIPDMHAPPKHVQPEAVAAPRSTPLGTMDRSSRTALPLDKRIPCLGVHACPQQKHAS